jgi:hypothetical protein
MDQYTVSIVHPSAVPSVCLLLITINTMGSNDMLSITMNTMASMAMDKQFREDARNMSILIHTRSFIFCKNTLGSRL